MNAPLERAPARTSVPSIEGFAANLGSQLRERFLAVSREPGAELQAASLRSIATLERTRQPAILTVLASSRLRAELFALWRKPKDGPQRSLGYWGYVDGEFRFVGWLYVVRGQGGDQLELWGPEADIQEIEAAKENPVPQYPPLARQAKIQGTVRLKATVAADGSVTDVGALDGHPLLIQSSLDAVKRWRYTAMKVNGRTVEVVLLIEINYALSS